MVYEIEKRAIINKNDFNNIKNDLEKRYGNYEYDEMKSFLFNKPKFFRIRLVKGKENAVLTYKTGDYSSDSRKELNIDIKKDQLKIFVEMFEEFGFKNCSLVHTKRYTFKKDELKIELNDIDYLGFILEVEALSEKEIRIDELKKQIETIFSEMNLEILDSDKYQLMMDSMYEKSLKPISEHLFEI